MSKIIEFRKLGETNLKKSKNLKRTIFTTHYQIIHNLKDFVQERNDLTSLFQATTKVQEDMKQEFLNALAITSNFADDDKISASFTGLGLEGKLFMPYKRKKDIKGNELLELFEKWSQSNTEFLMEGEISMTLLVLESPKSISGERRNVTVNDNSSLSRSVVVIKNNDFSCGYRAIAVGCYYLDCENLAKLSQVTERIRKVESAQLAKTVELCEKCLVDLNEPMSIDILKNNIQPVLLQSNIRVVVVDSSNKTNFLYRGPKAKKTLYVEYLNPSYDYPNGHYNYISNIRGYFKTRYFCETCDIGFSAKVSHLCNKACLKCCSEIEHSSIQINLFCEKCQQMFEYKECFENHLKNKKCKEICQICLRKTYKYTDHDCHVYHCRECKEPYHSSEQPHYCFIKPTNKEKLIENDNIHKIIIAYDIETIQKPQENIKLTSNETKKLKHVPILLISQIFCDNCFDSEDICSICGLREKIFVGEKCVKEFLDYIFYTIQEKVSDSKHKIFAFAHNAKGFDAHFLLREVVKIQFNSINIVLQGRKILKMDINKVRFIDSLCFFQLPLSKLSKAFGLDETA